MSPTLLVNPGGFEAGIIAAAKARESTPARVEAFVAFARSGLPSRRMEAWKWTDLKAALRKEIAASDVDNDVIAPSHLAGMGLFEVILMNGRAAWAGTPPDGVAISFRANDAGLCDLAAGHPTANLAAAMAEGRLEIVIAAGARPATTIHLRRIAGPGCHHQRLAFRVEEGAVASVVETFEGAGEYYSNSVAEFMVGASARLDRTIIAEGSDEGVETHFSALELGLSAAFNQTALIFGARLMRIESSILVSGSGAKLALDSAAMVGAERHGDLTSHVRFCTPSSTAVQRHKAALDDRARGVFQGKFTVARSAHKTDARMRAAALLLSDLAEASQKPELEIYADDVQCAHGSAIGALDADAFFYLRQRGLEESEARALLVEGFVGEIFEGAPNEQIAAALRRSALRWLGRAN